MKPTLSAKIVAKAQSAMISAVEVYNRPSFNYREETFAILALNAWELLLKAKILHDGGNKPRLIWAYAPRNLKNGKSSKKLYPILNRTKNNLTISIFKCIKRLPSLNADVAKNIEALVEIRDNSTHYFTAGRQLAEQTAALCVATVKNFVLLAREWFGLDFSKSFSLCLPLAFVGYNESVSTVTTGGEKKLLKYLAELASTQAANGDYAIALSLGVKFERTISPDGFKFTLSKDADALKVTISDEEALKRYPLTYAQLTNQLTQKIAGFLQNQKYHDIRQALEKDGSLALRRILDPNNPKSSKQWRYSNRMAVEIEKQWPTATVV